MSVQDLARHRLSGVRITRPNGKLYRPRKIETQLLGNEDQATAVAVFGTHDISTARGFAQPALDEYLRDMGGWWQPGYTLTLADEGERLWLRAVPDGTDDGGEMRIWFKEDPDRGRACVRFKLVETEVVDVEPEREGIMPPPLDGVEL